jgi:RHS repeat-associated protein
VTFDRGVLAFKYADSTGQLVGLDGPDSTSLTFTYDGFLPTTVTWGGPLVTGSVGVGYDSDFRVTSQTVNGGDSVAFGYDADGLLTAAGALGLKRSSTTGFVERDSISEILGQWTYDPKGALASYTATGSSGDTLFRTGYVRDSLSRITELTEIVQGDTTVAEFTYDDAGRLETVTRSGTLTASYEYDANGNRLELTTQSGTVTGTYDDQDRLLTYGSASYSHGRNGELAEKVVGTDTTRYTYDALGNLTQVTLPDGTEIEYVIDPQNRRIGKKVDGDLVQGFLWQGQLAPVAELDSAGNVVSRFVYATRVNVPDYIVKNDSTYRLVLDHLGSVRLVVNTADDSVVQRLDYDEFGVVTTNTNPGFQPFGFAGGLYDEQTGLVRFGARDYDAETGKWTSTEPLGFAGGYTNLYNYADADPLNLVDPDGTIVILPILGAAALWAGADLLWQLIVEGRDIGCVNWVRVGFAGALGGSLKALQGSVAVAKWAFTNPWLGVNSRLFGIGATLPGRGVLTRGLLNANPILRLGWGVNKFTGSFAFRLSALPKTALGGWLRRFTHHDFLRLPWEIGNALLPF